MAPHRRVLITGANGYIATRTIAHFLSKNWIVRGTIRDAQSRSAIRLSSHFAAEKAAGVFELVVVRDITIPGAFDEAVRDVHAIAHLATPVVFDSGDVEYIVGTAVRGTLSILESALEVSEAEGGREAAEGEDGGGKEEEKEKGLRSFILMSSASAVREPRPEPVTFTEKDWNTTAEAEVREAGDGAFGHVVYAASKVASERAFWDWVETKKPVFAASVLNPCWVAGPPLYTPSTPADITKTNAFIWKVFSGEDFPAGPSGYGMHVDVRDVARMSEWAASHPEIADGQRYLVGGNGNVGNPQAVADILRRAYPGRRHIIEEGTPGEGYQPGYTVGPEGPHVDSSKATNATGQGWIPYDKMVLDAAQMFEGLFSFMSGSLHKSPRG
ncbi:NAD dependent epimerase/dehydratase [Xylaria venustula]|nr:NAD dependent epimerase/dehydratase [Xylaria venustula]